MEEPVELMIVLKRLERWGAEREWVGPDPYEGLNSPLGRLARSRRLRQAVIQAYKRIPFRPPWPLQARPQPNSKALALALSGYASPVGRSLPGAAESLHRVPAALRAMSLSSDGSASWGYHFDVQTRHLYYRRDEPNAVATCFVVGALVDAFHATGNERHAELALAARPYLCSLLKSSRYGRFFAYVATGSELIHNANLLVSGALARLHGLVPDHAAAELALEAAGTTSSLQRQDGLWPYGERKDLMWIDNFHTAYTLEGFSHLEDSFGAGSEALQRGLHAWQAAFFWGDGGASLYHGRRFPLEPHSYASAIDLLCTIAARGKYPGATELALDLATGAIRALWLSKNSRFAFRRTRIGLNRREFMRWTNAPIFRALARLCSLTTGNSSARGEVQ